MARYAQISGELIRLFDTNAAQGFTFSPYDEVSGAVMVLDYAHHEIHEGDMYHVSGTATKGIGESYDLLFVTPDTARWAHLVGVVIGSGETAVTFYEGGTITGGTAVTPYNRNRNSENTPTTLVYHTPSVSDPGTALFTGTFGAGSRSGGEAREFDEWVLKRNTKYLLRMTSAATGNDLSWAINWYEHTQEGA